MKTFEIIDCDCATSFCLLSPTLVISQNKTIAFFLLLNSKHRLEANADFGFFSLSFCVCVCVCVCMYVDIWNIFFLCRSRWYWLQDLSSNCWMHKMLCSRASKHPSIYSLLKPSLFPLCAVAFLLSWQTGQCCMMYKEWKRAAVSPVMLSIDVFSFCVFFLFVVLFILLFFGGWVLFLHKAHAL